MTIRESVGAVVFLEEFFSFFVSFHNINEVFNRITQYLRTTISQGTSRQSFQTSKVYIATDQLQIIEPKFEAARFQDWK